MTGRCGTQAIWLHQGQVVEEGDPEQVAGSYMRYCRLSADDPVLDDT